MLLLFIRALAIALLLTLMPKNKRRRRLPKHLRKVYDRWHKIHERLEGLKAARAFRRSRLLYWRGVRKRRAKKYGEDDKRTKKAYHKERVCQALLEEIKKSQRVLILRAERKLKRIEKWEKRHPPYPHPTNGLIQVDGKWLSYELGKEVLRIRAEGRWKGYVVSGFRTPEYSEHLCYGICGHPYCPGLCAGRNTNHARKGGRNGAVDLTDYITFAQECRRLGSWLENHLPRDLVHFSDSGQ